MFTNWLPSPYKPLSQSEHGDSRPVRLANACRRLQLLLMPAMMIMMKPLVGPPTGGPKADHQSIPK